MSKPQDPKRTRPRTGGASAKPDAEIIEALMECGGRVAVAARKLGMSRAHLHRCIAASDTLKSAVEQAREELLDDAEDALRALIKAGDVQAVIFTLRTLGKKRGYTLNEAPAVTVNTNTTVNTGFGENPERQARLLEIAARLRASAREEAAREG